MTWTSDIETSYLVDCSYKRPNLVPQCLSFIPLTHQVMETVPKCWNWCLIQYCDTTPHRSIHVFSRPCLVPATFVSSCRWLKCCRRSKVVVQVAAGDGLIEEAMGVRAAHHTVEQGRRPGLKPTCDDRGSLWPSSQIVTDGRFRRIQMHTSIPSFGMVCFLFGCFCLSHTRILSFGRVWSLRLLSACVACVTPPPPPPPPHPRACLRQCSC